MERDAREYAVRCGSLFSATGAAPRSDRIVVIRDGVFVDVATREPRLPVLDLSGCFVMPGFVDAHAHLSTTALFRDDWPRVPNLVEQALSVPGNLRTGLFSGTTTMRVMGEDEWLDVHARAAVSSGEMLGPNLVIATRAVTAAKCARIDVTDDTVGVRRIIGENFDHGADFVKIHLTEGAEGGREALFSAGAVAAAVDEARRRGSYVSAHAHGGRSVIDAIGAGIRVIEHGFDLSDDDIAAMVAHGVWLVSTLAFDFQSDGLERVIHKFGADYVLDDLIAQRRDIEEHMRAAVAAGVRIAFGSNHLPGAMSDEIRLGIRMGMTVTDALIAATSGGADLLGMTDRIGSIAPGKNADLIAFRGDPFADLNALDDVAVVVKDGVVELLADGVAA